MHITLSLIVCLLGQTFVSHLKTGKNIIQCHLFFWYITQIYIDKLYKYTLNLLHNFFQVIDKSINPWKIPKKDPLLCIYIIMYIFESFISWPSGILTSSSGILTSSSGILTSSSLLSSPVPPTPPSGNTSQGVSLSADKHHGKWTYWVASQEHREGPLKHKDGKNY